MSIGYSDEIEEKETETESPPARSWGFAGAALAWLLYGIFSIFWNGLSRKSRTRRDVENL
jgi:hypothetical protein